MKGIKGLQGNKSYMGDNMMRGSMKKRGTNMNLSMSSIPNRSGRCVLGPGSHTVSEVLGPAPVLQRSATLLSSQPGHRVPRLSTLLGLSHVQDLQKIDSKSQLIP